MPGVQLGENGPKFATYNVGVTDGKAESFGNYYCWGGKYANGADIKWCDDSKGGEGDLTADEDAATQNWGSNWRMPTSTEFENLLDNCTWKLTTQEGFYGLLCTGKDDYVSNCIFLPAAGSCVDSFEEDGNGILDGVKNEEDTYEYGQYFSSTSNPDSYIDTENGPYYDMSLSLFFGTTWQGLFNPMVDEECCRYFASSVRAVLNE